MGGRYSLVLAVDEPRLAAIVAYYGAPPTDPAAIARIKAPILGNYGADDKGPSPEQVKPFEAAMKKAGKSIDVKIYAGAPPRLREPQQSLGRLSGGRGQGRLGAYRRVLRGRPQEVGPAAGETAAAFA